MRVVHPLAIALPAAVLHVVVRDGRGHARRLRPVHRQAGAVRRRQRRRAGRRHGGGGKLGVAVHGDGQGALPRAHRPTSRARSRPDEASVPDAPPRRSAEGLVVRILRSQRLSLDCGSRVHHHEVRRVGGEVDAPARCRELVHAPDQVAGMSERGHRRSRLVRRGRLLDADRERHVQAAVERQLDPGQLVAHGAAAGGECLGLIVPQVTMSGALHVVVAHQHHLGLSRRGLRRPGQRQHRQRKRGQRWECAEAGHGDCRPQKLGGGGGVRLRGSGTDASDARVRPQNRRSRDGVGSSIWGRPHGVFTGRQNRKAYFLRPDVRSTTPYLGGCYESADVARGRETARISGGLGEPRSGRP